MRLLSISFEELLGKPREWVLEKADFGEINLIVGKNSTGKSRLLNVINGLARLLSGEQRSIFDTTHYIASFDFNEKNYIYELKIDNFQVVKENLKIDGKVYLSRNDNGEGDIFTLEMNGDMRFQTPTTELAVVNRRDSIQHPFLEELHIWGKTTKHYLFGSEFGKNQFTSPGLPKKEGTDIQKSTIDPSSIIGIYEHGIKTHGDKYKESVLDDFKSLGYSCTDVLVANINEFVKSNIPLFGLAVQEDDLKTITPQIVMSQGMFRALALVIQINFNVFEKKPFTILVDDIGEGLDYSRASSTILLLIEKTKNNNFQLIMTTNDKFIMNVVDLKYWSILNRTGSNVRIFNKNNSPKSFEEFKFIGLSNFDFFSNEYFLEKKSES